MNKDSVLVSMNAQCLLSGKRREERRSLRGVLRGAAEDQWTIMMRPPCVLGLTTILKRLDAVDCVCHCCSAFNIDRFCFFTCTLAIRSFGSSSASERGARSEMGRDGGSGGVF